MSTTSIEIKGTLTELQPGDVELTCPLQVIPGNFFSCSVDIPRGSGEQMLLTMTDDLSLTTDTTTLWMDIPDPWTNIPGGAVGTATFNSGQVCHY